ncbi:MAG: TetR/AcrR family transcriptional regulator [Firmicutes bacterium]|nr:TetR/AcrR family transcriptional regulator [Bacillota bacterium]
MKRLPSDERKEEILSKALAIIFESGARSLTMRSLAQRVGLSEAAIYRHFRHKEDLIQNLTNQTCDPLLAEGLEKSDPWEALQKLMQRQLQRLSEKPQLTAIIFQEELFSEYPQIKQKLMAHQKEKKELIQSALARGQKEGVFKPNIEKEIFTLIYMGSVRMAALNWKESGFSYSLPKQGERILSLIESLLKEDENDGAGD